jgi:ribose transport system permease protein
MINKDSTLEAKLSPRQKTLQILSNLRLLIILILIVIIFSLVNPGYISGNNLYVILMSISVLGLAAIGQTLCLITGGFDISVGAIVLITSVTAAYMIKFLGINIWLAFLIVLIEGAFIGSVNGFIITKMRVNPLITTLAMMTILTGASQIFTRGQTIVVNEENFRFLGTYRIFGIKFFQINIIIMVIMFIVFFIILGFTYYGKYIYAIGANKDTAKFTGINVDNMLVSVYMLSGLLSALGGYILASRLGSAQPGIGGFFPLLTVAGAVLGGVSLSGGKGNTMGTLLGLLILQSLNIGLIGLGLETFFQDIASGLVLILAVFIDIYRKNKTI